MITLILGGARSGKSALAERVAAAGERPVVYVATASVSGDADFDERVRRHRERRPAGWSTAEPGAELVPWLQGAADDGSTLLIDSLGTWVAATPDFAVDHAALCAALAARRGDTVVVSEEVGLGVHPSTEVGGRFRDALGTVNQAVAAVADEAWLVVAGRILPLERPPLALSGPAPDGAAPDGPDPDGPAPDSPDTTAPATGAPDAAAPDASAPESR